MKSWKKVAPRDGLEPPTNRLTADCSTTELPRNRTRCLARLVWHDQKKCSPTFRGVPRQLGTESQKKEAGFEPGPKALGNGGVSSRKTRGSCAATVNNRLRLTPKFQPPVQNGTESGVGRRFCVHGKWRPRPESNRARGFAIALIFNKIKYLVL